MKIPEVTDTRTTEQNSLMWALLNDIASQVKWPVDGKEQLISPDDWKHIMTAGLRKNQRVAAGIEGGFVILGQYTHKMKKAEMAELIELIQAFGAEKSVVWSDQ